MSAPERLSGMDGRCVPPSRRARSCVGAREGAFGIRFEKEKISLGVFDCQRLCTRPSTPVCFTKSNRTASHCFASDMPNVGRGPC